MLTLSDCRYRFGAKPRLGHKPYGNSGLCDYWLPGTEMSRICCIQERHLDSGLFLASFDPLCSSRRVNTCNPIESAFLKPAPKILELMRYNNVDTPIPFSVSFLQPERGRVVWTNPPPDWQVRTRTVPRASTGTGIPSWQGRDGRDAKGPARPDLRGRSSVTHRLRS